MGISKCFNDTIDILTDEQTQYNLSDQGNYQKKEIDQESITQWFLPDLVGQGDESQLGPVR